MRHGGTIRRRRSGDTYDGDFTPSDDDEDYDEGENREENNTGGLMQRPNMQVLLKEKEDALVQRALDRIAHARALGKTNVKLSRAEIDALERSERIQNPPPPPPVAAPKTAPKGKKAVQTRTKAVERKKPGKNGQQSGSSSPKGKGGESRSRGQSNASNRSGRDPRDDAMVPYPAFPADQDYAYVGGRLMYGQQGHYIHGPRQAGPSRQGSRTNSIQSLRQQPLQPMPVYQHPYYASRYYSNPDSVLAARPNSSRASRPDPSEPDWEPRARSTSSLVDVPLDQLPYQRGKKRAPRFDPSDPRFASPQRRAVSGPAAVHPGHAPRRRPQDELFLPDEEELEVNKYRISSGADDNDDDDDYDNDDDEDDEDNDRPQGVSVNVSETSDGGYTIQTRSTTVSKSGRGNKSTGSKGTKRK